jgi:hypothetical protein
MQACPKETRKGACAVKRMHGHVSVANIETAVGFHSALFATKRKVYAHLKTVGGTVIEQGKTACCYARSEKSWIDDPAGISWETFHTNISYGDGSGEDEARVAHAKACCVPAAQPATGTSSACCAA